MTDGKKRALIYEGQRLNPGATNERENITVFFRDGTGEVKIALSEIKAVYPPRKEKPVRLGANGEVIERKPRSSKSVPLASLGTIDLDGSDLDAMLSAMDPDDFEATPDTEETSVVNGYDDGKENEDNGITFEPVDLSSSALDVVEDGFTPEQDAGLDDDFTYDPSDFDVVQPEPEEVAPAKKPSRKKSSK
jgi:hypothetical protein